MLESGWLFTGVVALLSTGVALSTQYNFGADSPNADGIAIISGVIGFVSWSVWTFGTLNVETITESGSTVTSTMPELTFLGLALALVPGYIALTGPVNIIARYRDPDSREI